LATCLTKRLQVANVAWDTVVVNILPIRHTFDASIATHPKAARGAMVHIGYINALPFQGRLAKASAEQLCRNGAIFLAYLDVNMITLAMHHAGLRLYQGRKRQGEKGSNQPYKAVSVCHV